MKDCVYIRCCRHPLAWPILPCVMVGLVGPLGRRHSHPRLVAVGADSDPAPPPHRAGRAAVGSGVGMVERGIDVGVSPGSEVVGVVVGAVSHIGRVVGGAGGVGVAGHIHHSHRVDSMGHCCYSHGQPPSVMRLAIVTAASCVPDRLAVAARASVPRQPSSHCHEDNQSPSSAAWRDHNPPGLQPVLSASLAWRVCFRAP